MASWSTVDVLYRERDGWGLLALTVAALAAGFVVDLVTGGGGAHALGWLLAVLLVGGTVAVGCYARVRAGALYLTPGALRVGREVLPLAQLDAGMLREVDRIGGPQAGARILGGALSLPAGRAPLPLRLTDGSTVVVPSRDPDALRAALLGALPR